MSDIIKFTVKSLNGDSYKMTEKITTTVGSVMNKIQTVSNGKYPSNSVRLIYAGKDISSDSDKNRTIDDFGLAENSTLFIVMRLDGGHGGMDVVQE